MADSAPALVRELNNVLFPTLGSPTIPNFIFTYTCLENLAFQGFLPFTILNTLFVVYIRYLSIRLYHIVRFFEITIFRPVMFLLLNIHLLSDIIFSYN